VGGWVGGGGVGGTGRGNFLGGGGSFLRKRQPLPLWYTRGWGVAWWCHRTGQGSDSSSQGAHPRQDGRSGDQFQRPEIHLWPIQLVHLCGCFIAVCFLLLPQVAPGIAWGLWRPIVVALEPAMAAQLAVSAVHHSPHSLHSLTHSLITSLRPCRRTTSGQLLEQCFADGERGGGAVALAMYCRHSD